MDINGAQSSVSDLDNLKETLKNLEFDISDKNSKKKDFGSIPKDPQYNDIVKELGNLDMVIPMGFIMLHNDLQKLIDLQSENVNTSSNGGGITSAITAGATTVSAISDVISLIKSPAGLEDILNNKEINEALAKDPSVYEIRLQGTLGYLKSYYMNLIKNNGYLFDFDTDTLEDNGSFDVGEFFKDFTDAIGSGIGKAIEAVGEAMGNIEAHKELNSLESVKAIRSLGYSAYLKTYYANLVQPNGYRISAENLNNDSFLLQEDTNIASILDDISQGVVSIMTNSLDGLGNTVTNLVKNIELNSDEDVKSTRKLGYIAYLKTYYANLVQPNGYRISADNLNNNSFLLQEDTNIASILDDISQGVVSLLTNSLEGLGNTVTNLVKNIELNSDEDVKSTRKLGYIAYLKTYYANLVQPYGFKISADNLNNNSFALEEDINIASIIEDITQSLVSIITGSVDTIGNSIQTLNSGDSLLSESEVLEVRKKGMSTYLKTYYANLVKPQGYKVTLDGLNNGTFTLVEGVSAQSIANTFSSTVASLLTGAIDTFGTSVKTLMSSSSLDSDTGVKNIRSKGMSTYLKVYYENLINQFGYKISLDNLNKGNFILEKDESLGGWIKGALNDVSSTIGQSFSNLFSASANSILGVLDADSLKEDVDIKTIQKNGYSSYLKVHFDNLVNNFNKGNANFSKEDYKVINSAISSRIQEALKDDTLFNSSTNVEVNQMVEKTSSYNESNLFNKLDDVLKKLTSIVNALSYEASGSSISRLNTINTTLANGFDDIKFNLENVTPNVSTPVNEGNVNVDTGAQY